MKQSTAIHTIIILCVMIAMAWFFGKYLPDPYAFTGPLEKELSKDKPPASAPKYMTQAGIYWERPLQQYN